MMSNNSINDQIDNDEEFSQFLESFSVFVYNNEDKKPLRDLYRAIKHLPQTQNRLDLLKYIKNENEEIKKESNPEERKKKEQAILVKVLFEAYDNDDLEIFKEILNLDNSVAFIKNNSKSNDSNNGNCMFDILWKYRKYDEFFAALLDTIGSSQKEFNKILNEEFNKNNTEEICILLNNRIMSNFERCELNKDAIEFLKTQSYKKIIVEEGKEAQTEFTTISRTFFQNLFTKFNVNLTNTQENAISSNVKITDKKNNEKLNEFPLQTALLNSMHQFIVYILNSKNHKINSAILTDPKLNQEFFKNFDEEQKNTFSPEKFNDKQIEYVLENNIIWNEFNAFKSSLKCYNRNFLKKNLTLNAPFILKLLKSTILRKNLKILCEILDNILVEDNKYCGWAYIDELHDTEITLISYAIKWNNTMALNELLKRKSRLLLKDSFYKNNLQYFEINNDLIKLHLNKCLTSYKSACNNDDTIICYDFSNFIENLDFYDDLELLDENEINQIQNNKSISNQRWKATNIITNNDELNLKKSNKFSIENWKSARNSLFARKKKKLLLRKKNNKRNDNTVASCFSNNQLQQDIQLNDFQENYMDSNNDNIDEKETNLSEIYNKNENNLFETKLQIESNPEIQSYDNDESDKSDDNEFDHDDDDDINDEMIKSQINEMKFSNIIYEFSNREHLQHLLLHPIISAQIFLKWHELSLISLINFSITLITFISLLLYSYTKFVRLASFSSSSSSSSDNINRIDRSNDNAAIIFFSTILWLSVLHKFLRILMRIIQLNYNKITNINKILYIIEKLHQNTKIIIYNIINIIFIFCVIGTTIFTLLCSNISDQTAATVMTNATNNSSSSSSSTEDISDNINNNILMLNSTTATSTSNSEDN